MIEGIAISAIAAWYLTGLSWTVGLVVYPSFSRVGEETWQEFHAHHARAITFAVGPVWFLQAVGLSLWLITMKGSTWVTWALSALGALATVGLTILGAIPRHNRLTAKREVSDIQGLLYVHWWRTASWTLCAVASTVALFMTLH